MASQAVLVCALVACRADPTGAEIAAWVRKAETAPAARVDVSHKGPPVALGTSGPGRFARLVFESFDADRALATVRFLDGFSREPASDGFEASLDHVADALREAGFGTDPRCTLEIRETAMEVPSWTPYSASLVLVGSDGVETVLHAFDDAADVDRTMLPRNAPSARVEGVACFALEDVREGSILVSDAPLHATLLEDALERRAVAVLSASLAPYNVDPSGAERHLDAIQYTVARHPCPLPVAQISPRALQRIRAASTGNDGARLRLQADVAFVDRPLRTVVATIVGAKEPDEAIVVAAHVQEPGACDNASGVATVLEGLCNAADLVRAGRIEPPARSVVCLFGDEMRQSEIWLSARTRRTIAAISADMTGESQAHTGAMQLLERPPDPSNVRMLPPDEHTAWGQTAVPRERIRASGIAIVARTALADTGTLAPQWPTAEHPFEGGSDHQVFLTADVPAVLFWHFPDFAYHTSLDRLAHVDASEMRRCGTAIFATALALADPRPSDLTRYLETLRWEQGLRLRACEIAGDDELAALWIEWFRDTRAWLRTQCLWIRTNADATTLPPLESDEPLPEPTAPTSEPR